MHLDSDTVMFFEWVHVPQNFGKLITLRSKSEGAMWGQLSCLSSIWTSRRTHEMPPLTSYLDGSQVYGSTAALASFLREFKGGRLRVGPVFPPGGLASLPTIPPCNTWDASTENLWSFGTYTISMLTGDYPLNCFPLFCLQATKVWWSKAVSHVKVSLATTPGQLLQVVVLNGLNTVSLSEVKSSVFIYI